LFAQGLLIPPIGWLPNIELRSSPTPRARPCRARTATRPCLTRRRRAAVARNTVELSLCRPFSTPVRRVLARRASVPSHDAHHRHCGAADIRHLVLLVCQAHLLRGGGKPLWGDCQVWKTLVPGAGGMFGGAVTALIVSAWHRLASSILAFLLG